MSAHVLDVITLFGDSITQGAWEPSMDGFGTRLAHVYARKLDILNRGLSGYNTDWATPALQRCLATVGQQPSVPSIKLLTIWFGANDACIWPSPQHVPLEKFAANLRDWVDLVHSPDSHYYSPETRIILISPPPVNTYQRRADLESREPARLLDRDFETTRKYAEAVKKVAQDTGTGFTDVWTVLWEAAGKQEQALSQFLYDGLHPNKEGYSVIYDALIKTIATKYPEVHYDNLPEGIPAWLTFVEGSDA